jgi:acyl-CoA reductase-like NAD-dependent aldehyde dehydrogenase
MLEVVTSFIGGAFTDGAGATRLPVINPHDESVVAELAEADKAEVERAVAAARAAVRPRRMAARPPVAQRQKVLRRIASLIRERRKISSPASSPTRVYRCARSVSVTSAAPR